MPTEREEWWAYAGLDVSAFEEGVGELAGLGNAVVSVFRNLDNLRLGNPDQWRQQGRAAARAYIEGIRSGLAGMGLQQFIGQQLRIEPAAMRGLEQDLTAIESRIRALGMGNGAGRAGVEQLGSMRALEDQANRSTRAMADANAQLLAMRQQLSAMAGLSIPRTVFQRQGDAIRATGPAAAIASATGVELTPQLTSRGQLDQASGRARLQAALQAQMSALEGQILSATGQRLALPAGPGIGGQIFRGSDGQWRSQADAEAFRASRFAAEQSRIIQGTVIPSTWMGRADGGRAMAMGSGITAAAKAAIVEEERLARVRAKTAQETARAAAAEGGRGGRGGVGGGGRISAGGADDEESFSQRLAREMRERGFIGPDAAEFQRLAEEKRFRGSIDSAAAEQARQSFRDSLDFEGASERADFNERRRDQGFRRQRATFNARESVFGSFDEDEFGMTEAQRFNEQRRRQNLRGFLASDAGFFDKAGAAFTGRAPGDTTPGISMGQQFMGGFLGASAQPVMSQLGQTAKFSLFYGAMYAALFQLSRGFGIAIQGVIQFEDALTDLNIITGRSRSENERWADSLGELGTGVGFTAAQGVQAGARAVGLFGVAQAPASTQRSVAALSTEVAGRIAFLSGEQDIESTQVQVAGLVRSFGLGTFGQRQLEDQLAFLRTQTGQSQKDMIEGATQIGTLAGDAGFDLPETFALISQIAKTTGKTPTAVAGSLPQVFSKIDDASVEAKLRGLGVDTTGSMRDQFAQLNDKLQSGELPQEQFNRIVQQFGRGFSGQSVRIIVSDFDRITGLAEGARNAEPGLGEAQFNESVQAIGQQIRLLGGDFKEFAKDLASTGVLDFVYGLVVALRTVLQAGDAVLDLFNSIPRPLRTVAFALLEMAAAARLFGGMRVAGVLSSVATFVRANTVASAGQAALGGGLAAAAGAGGLLRGAGRLAARATPFAVPLALLSAMSQVNLTEDLTGQLRQAQRAAADARGVGGLREAANQQGEVVRAMVEAQDVGLDDIDTLFIAPLLRKLPFSSTSRDQQTARDSRDNLNAQAKALEEAEERARNLAPESSFGDFSTLESVNEGLSQLAERGFSAAQQLELVNTAFDNMIRVTGQSEMAAVLNAGQGEVLALGAGRAAGSAVQNVSEILRGRAAGRDPRFLEDQSFIEKWITGDLLPQGPDWLNEIVTLGSSTPGQREGRDLNDMANRLAGADGAKIAGDVKDRALAVLRERGKDTTSGPVFLSDEDVRVLREETGKALAESLGKDWDKLGTDDQNLLINSFNSAFQTEVGAFGVEGATKESVRTLLSITPALAEGAGEEASILAGGDSVAGAQATTAALKAAQAQAQAMVDNIEDPAERVEAARSLALFGIQVAAAEQAEAQALAQRAQALASLAASGLGLDDTVGRADANIVGLREAARLATADQRPAAQAALNEALAKRDADALRASGATALSEIDPRARRARLGQEIANASDLLDTLTPGSEQFAQTTEQLNNLLAQAEDYMLDQAKAVGLLGVGVGDSVGRAQVGVQDAARRLQQARRIGDPLAIANAQQGLREASFESAKQQAERFIARGVEDTDSRDTLQGITDQIWAAQVRKAIAQFGGDATGVATANAEIARLRLQAAAESRAITSARGRAGVRPGDTVGFAAQAVTDASRELAGQLPGTRSFFEAQIALAEAQQQYSDQLRAYNSTLRQLSGDITDPVENARDAVADAMEQLRAADTAPERADAQLALRQAQNGEEASAFEQRMHDSQTLEQLGRMSHASYISYLQSERENLLQMGISTRARKERLDEIDLALKSSTEQLAGSQFNLGEIRVPTPFEVRRSIAAGGGLGATIVDYSNSNNTVTINGADLAQVIAYIQQATGSSLPRAAVRKVG